MGVSTCGFTLWGPHLPVGTLHTVAQDTQIPTCGHGASPCKAPPELLSVLVPLLAVAH